MLLTLAQLAISTGGKLAIFIIIIVALVVAVTVSAIAAVNAAKRKRLHTHIEERQ
jgi:hypothetical protein